MGQQFIRRQEFTFFDLDMAPNGETIEYVKAWGFHTATLTEHSELTRTNTSDGSMTFTASKEGNGDDGPEDPLMLTIQQKNRALTLEWANFTEFDLEFGCSDGWHTRYFTFVARPSLWCAQTSTPFGVGPNPQLSTISNTAAITSIETITTLVGTTTTLADSTEKPRTCWFSIFSFSWCANKR